jgi:hypothetical protein
MLVLYARTPCMEIAVAGKLNESLRMVERVAVMQRSVSPQSRKPALSLDAAIFIVTRTNARKGCLESGWHFDD